MDELQFKGYVLQWVGEIIKADPTLPFSKLEQEYPSKAPGKPKKKCDLALYDAEEKVALVGEIKLPDRPLGHSPYNPKLVRDAHDKADDAGIKFFFTWNVNDFVLWQTFKPGVPLHERNLTFFPIVYIADSAELEKKTVRDRIKKALKEIIHEFALYYLGEAELKRPPDKTFVNMLNTYLNRIAKTTTADLYDLYVFKKDKKFRRDVIKWIRYDQHWTFPGTKETLEEDLERAARLGAYIQVIKFVFYEALRQKFKKMAPLKISRNARTGQGLKKEVHALWQDAIGKSGDYLTVFALDFADEIPYLSDAAVVIWKELISNIEDFDFSRLGHEVIGQIFETLIAPLERHKYGQHYTRDDVVDLIVGFCSRTSEVEALDPACGGGTFLVRAYNRKKYYDASLKHQQLIQDIYGIDKFKFPCHLSAVNLAIRDIIRAENYPRIGQRDFFDAFPLEPVIYFPDRKIPIPYVDAVFGNPPYIRQEIIEDKKKIDGALKRDFATWGIPKTSKRSDIYVYFFLHGTAFLKEGGYFGLITSNSWLDVDYGKHLQNFFLDYYQIVAVIESKVERWFPDASINTAITILRRQSDPKKRDENIVRFVQIKVPLEKLLPREGSELLRWQAVDRLVKEIESTTKITETDYWRICPKRQKELYEEGLDDGNYVGSKWGKYLRAPEVFFEILEKAGDKLCPLSEVADVRFGIKTGANDFFYLKNLTDKLPESELKDYYGLTRKEAERIRVCQAGDGSTHLIEAEFLRPVVKSPREIKSIQITPNDLKFKVLMLHRDKKALKGKKVLKYINYGERKGYHERPTCKSREKWWDLGERMPWPILHPMIHNERQAIGDNRKAAQVDHNLFEILPHSKAQTPTLLAYLTSMTAALIKENYGRVSLGEGALKTEGVDLSKMFVLNPAKIKSGTRNSLRKPLTELGKRGILSIFEEVSQPDRRELDSLVLKALGFTKKAERERVLNELYEAVCDLVKSRLEKARSVPKKEKTIRAEVRAMAEELWEEFDKSLLKNFPQDFLSPLARLEEIEIPEDEAVRPEEFVLEGKIEIGGKILSLGSEARAEYVKILSDLAKTGAQKIPRTDQAALDAVNAYRRYLKSLSAEFERLAETRTEDKKLIKGIVQEMERQLLKERTG